MEGWGEHENLLFPVGEPCGLRQEWLASTWGFVSLISMLVFLGRPSPAEQENYSVNHRVR